MYSFYENLVGIDIGKHSCNSN